MNKGNILLRVRSSTGRGGGRADASLPFLDGDTASLASLRLPSACRALAPKCNHYSFTAPYLEGRIAKSFCPNSTGVPFSMKMCTTSPATSEGISFISFIASTMQRTVFSFT